MILPEPDPILPTPYLVPPDVEKHIDQVVREIGAGRYTYIEVTIKLGQALREGRISEHDAEATIMSLQSKLKHAAAEKARIAAEDAEAARKRAARLPPGVPVEVNRLTKSKPTVQAVQAADAAEDESEGSAPVTEALDPEAADEFEAAAAQYSALGDKINALEAQRAKAREILVEHMNGCGYKSLLTDDLTVTAVPGAMRKTLVPKLLLEAGVTVEQLEKGTEIKQSAGYVKVTKTAETPVVAEAERMAPKLPVGRITRSK